jgi:hypothetical protein
MSSAPSTRNRIAIWLGVGAAVLLVAAANAHLVYVAATSQPECVSHLRPGDSGAARGSFSAAKSACSPQRGKP